MDLSTRSELDGLAATLQPIAKHASERGVQWLLIGAAARDLILQYGYGLQPSRATLDVDLAIQMPTWEDDRSLRKVLEEREGARPHPELKQRLLLASGERIDLVPFGGVEAEGWIAWPPEEDPDLSVLGLAEALEHATTVSLPRGIEALVPTIEHYVALKLLAWSDRHIRRPRHDSVDLADVFRNADALISLEEMYSEHEDILEENDFDHGEAVLHVLGRRLRSQLRPLTRQAVEAVLRTGVDTDGRLDLVREMRPAVDPIRMLTALLRGIDAAS